MIKNDSADGFDLDAVMQATGVFGVSHQIRERRLALRWSQADLSRQSGVSKTMINGIESGERNPTHQTIKKIAEAMKLFVILELVPADVLLVRAANKKEVY